MKTFYNKQCKCGCNKYIPIKSYHKSYGIPYYIQGHNPTSSMFKKGHKPWNTNLKGDEWLKHFKKGHPKGMLGKKAWNAGLKKGIFKSCIICNKKFYVVPHNINKTNCCSKSCSNKYVSIIKTGTKYKPMNIDKRKNMKRLCITEQRKNKKLEDIYGYEKAEKIKRKIKNTVLNNYNKNPELKKILKEKRKLQKVVYESNIEKILQKNLQNINIKFIKHKYISNIKHSYQCDIFIKPNIVIECDGNYWHNYPNYNEIDLVRTKELKKAGYKVLRFWESDINNNFKKVKEEIKNAIK